MRVAPPLLVRTVVNESKTEVTGEEASERALREALQQEPLSSERLAPPFNHWGSWTIRLRRVGLFAAITAVPLIVDLYVRSAVAMAEDQREVLEALLADFGPPNLDGLVLLVRLTGLVVVMIGLTRLFQSGRLARTAGAALILGSLAWRGI